MRSASYVWASNAADLLLAFAAAGCIVFVMLYSRSNWRASAVGQNVMAFMVVCAVLLTLGVIRAFTQPPDHVLEIARLIAYALVVVVVWQRVYLLFRTQHEDDEDPSRDRKPDTEDTPEEGLKL